MTIVKLCKDCKPHDYQDKRYGKNMHVMNATVKPLGVRCTVCGKVHSGSVKDEKKE